MKVNSYSGIVKKNVVYQASSWFGVFLHASIAIVATAAIIAPINNPASTALRLASTWMTNSFTVNNIVSWTENGCMKYMNPNKKRKTMNIERMMIWFFFALFKAIVRYFEIGVFWYWLSSRPVMRNCVGDGFRSLRNFQPENRILFLLFWKRLKKESISYCNRM